MRLLEVGSVVGGVVKREDGMKVSTATAVAAAWSLGVVGVVRSIWESRSGCEGVWRGGRLLLLVEFRPLYWW